MWRAGGVRREEFSYMRVEFEMPVWDIQVEMPIVQSVMWAWGSKRQVRDDHKNIEIACMLVVVKIMAGDRCLCPGKGQKTRDSFFNPPTKSSEQRRRSQKETEGEGRKLWQGGQGRGFQRWNELPKSLWLKFLSDFSLAFFEQRVQHAFIKNRFGARNYPSWGQAIPLGPREPPDQ